MKQTPVKSAVFINIFRNLRIDRLRLLVAFLKEIHMKEENALAGIIRRGRKDKILETKKKS